MTMDRGHFVIAYYILCSFTGTSDNSCMLTLADNI